LEKKMGMKTMSWTGRMPSWQTKSVNFLSWKDTRTFRWGTI
jgi:hypothetical protein